MAKTFGKASYFFLKKHAFPSKLCFVSWNSSHWRDRPTDDERIIPGYPNNVM